MTSGRVLVVGGGVIGLTTALCLKEHGHAVVLVQAPRDPMYASSVAGAVWLAYEGHEPREMVFAWSAIAHARFMRIARGIDADHGAKEGGKKENGGEPAAAEARERRPSHGVRIGRVIEAHESPIGGAGDPRVAPYFSGTPSLDWRVARGREAVRSVAPGLAEAGFDSAFVIDGVPLVEPALFLPWLERQLERGPNPVDIVRDFAVEDVVECAEMFKCNYAVVAAGLGSARLMARVVGEERAGKALGIRGQVRIVERPEAKDWPYPDSDTCVCMVPRGAVYGTEPHASDGGGDEAYIIPRTDSVVLGGTFERGVTDPAAVSRDVAVRITRKCAVAAPALATAAVRSDICGIRPGLEDGHVRCGVLNTTASTTSDGSGSDPSMGGAKRKRVTVLANYGHAGLGYTMSFGCAEHVAHQVDALVDKERHRSRL